MAQTDKGPRDLVGTRLAHDVYVTIKDIAPDRMMGPYIADLTALFLGCPDLVTDWNTVGVLPTNRPIYDAALKAAAERGICLVDLVDTLIAEGLGRPELIDEPRIAEQEVLPFGDKDVA